MASKSLTLSLALGALLCVPLALGAFADPVDPPSAKDDALDGLLKKIEDDESNAVAKPAAAEGQGTGKTNSKARGEVAGKDKDLDSLLEKLGTTDDKPSPEERRGGAAGQGGESQPGEKPPADKPDQGQKKNSTNALKGADEELDRHLEEASGKRRKKKSQKDEDGGALSQVIKEMREVEERLGKPDTGEETRKKQSEIVKKIETLIEQAKNSQGQSQGKKKSLAMGKGKAQPGQQKGDQTGTNGGNAPFTKPQKPTDRRSLAGGKELWGDLPPEVRQDLDNVMKEGFLPSREELIRRYHLSLSKKKANRGE